MFCREKITFLPKEDAFPLLNDVFPLLIKVFPLLINNHKNKP